MPVGVYPRPDPFLTVFNRAERMPNGCLIWPGKPGSGGYGRVDINHRRCRAHRVVWEIVNGPIPDGMFVCHHCDTPLCVEVSHLFLGTHSDNMADMAAKGRQARRSLTLTHCKHGHEYTPANTYRELSKKGYWKRRCRICRAEADARRRVARLNQTEVTDA